MTVTTTHHIVLTKTAKRNLNEKALNNNVAHILGAMTKTMEKRGWKLVPRDVQDDGHKNWSQTELTDTDEWAYQLHFTVQHVGVEKPNTSELKSIAKVMDTRGKNPLGGRWRLSSIDGKPYVVVDQGEVLSIKDYTAYADVDIPEEFDEAFDHLYGLESHVARMRGALEAAIMSQFSNRYHVALIGPPGCGKSDMCETLATILGDEAVMKFDATATTAAGAIKQIDEAGILPRILVVEEIEKVNAEALSFLLALMDMRGEIRKTTAKKSIVKDTHILVIATVNNHDLFEKILAGALASRFSTPLWFRRPGKDVQARILAREIAKVDGDEDWIAPVIAYADEKGITDPRMLAALCLCGRDGWLDGSFVKMLSDTDRPQDY